MAAGTTEPTFSLILLGRVAFLRSGEPVTLTNQALKTLVLLVLNGSCMHRDAIVGHLWPDARVGSGRHQLRNLLTALRAAGLTLDRQGEAVVIREAVYCDVEDFIVSASNAVTGVHGREESFRLCLHAQSLWAGAPLEPWRYESWAIPVRDRAFGLQRRLWDLSHTLPSGTAWAPQEGERSSGA